MTNEPRIRRRVSRHGKDKSRGWSLEAKAAVVVLFSIAAAACDVTNPGPVADQDLNLTAVHESLVNGSGHELSRATGIIGYVGGVAAREMFPGGNSNDGFVPTVQAGNIGPDNVQNHWEWRIRLDGSPRTPSGDSRSWEPRTSRTAPSPRPISGPDTRIGSWERTSASRSSTAAPRSPTYGTSSALRDTSRMRSASPKPRSTYRRVTREEPRCACGFRTGPGRSRTRNRCRSTSSTPSTRTGRTRTHATSSTLRVPTFLIAITRCG